MDKIKTSFLLGAGTSKAVGKPKTDEITSQILSEKRRFATVHRQMEGNNQIFKEKVDIEIIEYLNRLRDIAQIFNTNKYRSNCERKIRHKVNYEDIVYFLSEIYSHLIGDFNTFGALLICQTKFHETVNDWDPIAAHIKGEDKEKYFINTAYKHINHTLREMLSGNTNKLDDLKFIVDVCNSGQFQLENIFSLNHDTVLEQLLDANNLNYIDGFGDKDGDLRKWMPQTYDNLKKNHIRLMKLHGSIDWRWFKLNEQNQSIHTESDILGIHVGEQDIDSPSTPISDSVGIKYEKDDRFGNVMLIGTENKLGEYTHLQYRELHSRFWKYLKETELLIVCGYGFGDSGINGQLLEWIQNEQNKKLIVVDVRDETDFFQGLEYQFRKKVDTGKEEKELIKFLQEEQKVNYVKSGIENATVKQIMDYLP